MNKNNDIGRNEMIGKMVEILQSKNQSLTGLKGKIIDETQNTITINSKHVIKKIIKNQVTMKLLKNKNEQIIDGKNIVGRSHERVMKK